MVSCFAYCKTEKTAPEGITGNFNAVHSNTSGLDFTNTLTPSPELNIIEYLYYYNGGGVGVGDINNDGLEDIYLSSNQGQDKLFLNEGNLRFKDITYSSGIPTSNSWSTGVSFDDINGDGFLDIYVCKVDPISKEKVHNLLLINNQDLSFTEKSVEYGLDFSGYSTQACFLDYDRDGDLDMYLANHSIHSVRSYGKADKRKEKDPLSGDRFYENKLKDKENKFVDVTEQVGIFNSPLGYALSVISTDLNHDGYTDIYVANDFHENDYIYINTKEKSFKESIADKMCHSSKFSMGVDVCDMNSDGLVDIFTTDMLPYSKEVALRSGGEDTDEVFNIRTDFGFEDQYARNHFQIQSTNNTFIDIALMNNTYATDWSWSVLLQDFDNNSFNDIFITNGIVKRPNDLDYIKFLNTLNISNSRLIAQTELDEIMEMMPAEKLPNILFSQEQDLKFTKLQDSKISKPSFSNGAAYSDLDNDGDLDLIVNNINDPVSLLENTNNNVNNYISFLLRSTSRSVKNSKVRIYYNKRFIEKEYTTTRGYQSSSSHNIHFGLGINERIDSVVINWSNGTTQNLGPREINKRHEIVFEHEGLNNVNPKSPSIESKVTLLPHTHIENEYSDYNEDKLIPELLSREGPAVVLADFNGDGFEDIFLGGARYQEAQLMLGNSSGKFTKRSLKDFKLDAKYEDADAASLDFDKDGDLDLYVVSGGNDFKELDKSLEDRLYLNDGKGNLKRLPLSLPHTNGSTVTVADFDGDGFEDIFVGARSIPLAYGLTPYSFILKNKSGFGVDLLHKERYGMLTDSQCADMDGDNDFDIILCGDWMNIKILKNDGKGDFTNLAENYEIENSSGLWNAISVADINKDGRLDIIGANAGTNFKWKASKETPVQMYVLDMDGNGKTEPVIFSDYFGENKLYASLEKLSSQIPSIKKQFLKHSDFSKISALKDFDIADEKNIVEFKKLAELRSMLFLANGESFKAVALPFQAQLSTMQDVMINENGELVFVGNHHEYLTELGKSMSNSGGVFSNFDTTISNYTQYKSLHLEQGLNSRNLLQTERSNYLVVPNNNIPRIIEQRN